MATEEATSTEVFRSMLEYLSAHYPHYDFVVLLPQLTRVGIISLYESALVLSELTPDHRGLCLFLKILPTKSSEKIKKSFDILRCSFENEVLFLNGQQNILDGQRIKDMGRTFADATADFQQRLESQVGKKQSATTSKTLNDLMKILEQIKDGQRQMAESVEKLGRTLVNDSAVNQVHPAEDSTEIPSTHASDAGLTVPVMPQSLACKTDMVWRVMDFQRQLHKKIDEWKAVATNIGIILHWDIDQSIFVDSLRGLTSRDKCSRFGAGTGIAYSHAKNALLRFWELSYGTSPIHWKEEFLKESGFVKCDVFLIVSDRDFDEYLWITRILKKLGKKFYFVRQIDETIKTQRRYASRYPSLVTVKAKIKSVLADLHQSDNIFLIDYSRHNYPDFGSLLRRLIEDLPEWKQRSFILSLDIISEEVIMRKVTFIIQAVLDISLYYEKQRLCDATRTHQIPVPDSNLAINGALILAGNEVCIEQFGLDGDSLQRMAEIWKCDVSKLNKVVTQSDLHLTPDGIDSVIQSMGGDMFSYDSAQRLDKETIVTVNILQRCISKLSEVATQVYKTATADTTLDEGTKEA